jgi:type II secretory pathway predicted ATPase ExeA
VGKSALLAAVLNQLPSHRYKVVYLEDTAASVCDLFRHIAYGLNLEPAFRRAALWRDLKTLIKKHHDEQDQQIVLVLDDAHLLPAAFLKSLGAFMNFAFDSRELLTVWLVGDSQLIRTLSLTMHHHLATRIRLRINLDPLERDEFNDWVVNCLSEAGCTRQIVSDMGMDAAFCATRGVVRKAAHLFDYSLRLCHEKNRDIVCEQIIEQSIAEVIL